MNRVFAYINTKCGHINADSVNEVLDILALDENKRVADLLDEKKQLKEKIDTLISLLSLRDAEIDMLKASLVR